MKFTFDLNGNTQPMQPMLGFDSVSIPPIAARVLHIIIDHKEISLPDGIKIPFPGDIIALGDQQLHA
jgi:hypothetical protein